MKRILLFVISLVLMNHSIFAGGIVTNTNQSAAYVRMLARDATLGIDGVYYNPAGLTLLGTGLHISLNNQSIFQNRTINSSYQYLNNGEYKGTVSAPLFPSIYAAFNVGKISISAGFNPIGGGGSAKFDQGLPSFEYNISDLVPSLASAGVTGYSADIYFEGQSIYWGTQAGISYAVNDILSLYAGARYVMASNSYQGHLRDIQVSLSGLTIRADALVGQIASQLTTAATSTQTMVDAGAGSLTFAQAEALGIITTAQQAQFEDGLNQLGYPVSTPITNANAIFSGAAQAYGAKATLLADQEADVTQTGHGITPIVGANINLLGKLLNIGIKYEFKTKMEVTNDTRKDVMVGFTSTGTPITQFPDGEVIPSDMPAMLSVGAALNLPKITLSAGYHQYFDKNARYGKTDANGIYIDNSTLIGNNNNEIAVGVEYHVNPFLLVSAGYLNANQGVKETFQSDMNPALSSNTGAIGGALKFTKLLTLNLGVLYTKYTDAGKNFTHYFAGDVNKPVSVKETYGKDNIIAAIGLDINLSK